MGQNIRFNSERSALLSFIDDILVNQVLFEAILQTINNK
jgi:hypothetical protein